MKLSYMIRYSWSATWNRYDRIFAVLNVFSVAITILIFVALTGLLNSFKEYTENILNRLPLRVEVFKSRDHMISDLSEIEDQIRAVAGVSSVYKRVPTFIEFANAAGNPVSGSQLPQGTTILPQEPFAVKTLDGEEVRLLDDQKLSSPYDEVGILVSFDFLKKLGYFAEEAMAGDRDTWRGELPQRLTLIVGEGDETERLPVPVVGVSADLERGGYIISEDFYNLVLHWQPDFLYMIEDRHGTPLVEPEKEITKAYYVLTQEQMLWIDENYEAMEDDATAVGLEAFLDTWETEEGFEERLTIASFDESLQMKKIEALDRRLRNHPQLAELSQVSIESRQQRVKSWDDFAAIEHRHQYIQAAVYLKDRSFIRPVLGKFRSMGLFASSPLERYLDTFERQENFFVGAAIAIFVLIAFLSAIVLFSTFYTGVQRKRKQIGILKAFGVSGWRIAGLFYAESLIISSIGIPLGAIAGTQIGVAVSDWINRFAGLSGAQLVFAFPLEQIAVIAAVVFLFCGVAILFPVRIAAKIDPAQVVRG